MVQGCGSSPEGQEELETEPEIHLLSPEPKLKPGFELKGEPRCPSLAPRLGSFHGMAPMLPRTEEPGGCCEKAFILNNLKKIELQGPEMLLEESGGEEGSMSALGGRGGARRGWGQTPTLAC